MSTPNAADDLCRASCAQLCTDFASFIDHGRQDEFIALFADNGVFARATGKFEGHEGLKRFVAARSANTVTRHLCASVHIDPLSPTQARGTCTALMFQGAFEGGEPALPLASAPPRVVDYTDEFVLTAKGWRFSSRTAQVIFTQENIR